MRGWTVVLLAMVAACGGRSGGGAAGPGAGGLPALDGIPVYDVPADRAGERVRRVWLATQRVLADAPPQPAAGLSMDDYGAWMRTEYASWLKGRLAAVKPIHEDLAALAKAKSVRDQLFAAVLTGWLHGDFVARVQALPPPEGEPEVVAEFKATLDDYLVPTAQASRAAYARCAELAPKGPKPMRPWAKACGQRGEELRALATRTVAPRKKKKVFTPPAECAAEEPWVDPDAPPPDHGKPMEIAVVVDPRFEPAETEKIAETVIARLAQLMPDRKLVNKRHVRQAEKLVREKRWRSGGPQCGQAPPIAAVLAEKHPNLVLARVSTICTVEGDTCWLQVYFDRAGTDDNEGVPASLSAELTGDAADADVWLDAATRLGDNEVGGILGALIGRRGDEETFFRVAETTDDDPFLRLLPTLNEEALSAKLLACHGGEGIASFRVKLKLSPAGKPLAVEAAPVTPPAADPEAEAQCISQALMESAWPCPRSRKPVDVETVVCLGR